MIRDRHRTASPNAGWTISAMAGALGRVLAKPGAYRLGQGGLPTVTDVETSIRIAARAVVLGVLASVAAAASTRLVISMIYE